MAIVVTPPHKKMIDQQRTLFRKEENNHHHHQYSVFTTKYESRGIVTKEDTELSLMHKIFPEYTIIDTRLKGNEEKGHPDFIIEKEGVREYVELKTTEHGLSQSQIDWMKQNKAEIKIVHISSTIRSREPASNRAKVLNAFYMSREPLSIARLHKKLPELHINTITRHVNALKRHHIALVASNVGMNKSEKFYKITESGERHCENT